MYIRDYNDSEEERQNRHLPGTGTGLAAAVLLLPELIKLHKGHIYLTFFIALAAFVLGVALHYNLIFKRLKKKHNNLRRTVFVSDGISIVFFIVSLLILFLRYKTGLW